MNKQKILDELNVSAPYFLFYLAVVTLYLTISNIINFFSEFLIVAYLISLLNVFILVKAGLGLRNKKRLGIILFVIYIILSLTIPLRPVFIDSFRYLQDVINIALVVYLLTNWKKWARS